MNIKAIFNKPDAGLLFLRVALGALMMAHGIPKFLGGANLLRGIGQAMEVLGISSFPLFWGFMAALTETLGGFLMIIGYKFRITMAFLTFVMFVAFLKLAYPFFSGTHILAHTHPLELGIVYFSLIFIGPGKYSVDKN